MASTDKHLTRINLLRQAKKAPKLKALATPSAIAAHLGGEVDHAFIENTDSLKTYRNHIEKFDLRVSNDEVFARLNSISTGNAVDNILEPVFLSLLDGTMRACNIGSKQGITPSRLYLECKAFTYSRQANSLPLDSYTEHLNERQNIETFGSQTNFNGGELSRNDQTVEIRDGNKMRKLKESYFDGQLRASDGYDGKDIYQYKAHAKSEGEPGQAAEVDHAISCAEICNTLKSNKALKLEDIKSIVNIDENLVVTSQQNNRGVNTGKFDKSKKELQQELDQGYTVKKNSNGKETKHVLSEEEKQTRKAMIEKMDAAKKKIDAKTNHTVLNNIRHDREVQKILVTDAANASSHQSLGDVILFAIKPLYFELRDCISNGIEEGVNAASFRDALTIRFGRLKDHVMNHAATLLKDVALGFIKNFFSMLLEGIVNCFVGVFKNIMRMVKEGFRVLMQIAPILKDKHTSMAQKGDAILKLVVGSLSIFASIGIESWLSSLGLPEYLAIILSSVLTAVITALVMFLLDKLDLFGANEALKKHRIDEILDQDVEMSKAAMIASIERLQ